MKKVFLLAVFLLAISCKRNSERPADILPPDMMINALIEIRTLEGQVASLTLGNDSSRVLYHILEERLFERLNLDTALYTKSYNYYILHPEEFIDITSAVIDSLKLRSQKISMPSTGNN